MMTLPLLDVAGVMADVDGLPGKLVPTLLRRLRAFDAKELVPIHREESGRREGKLDVVGAAMARIHSELIDFGLDADTLRGLRTYLDHRADAVSPKSHFAVAVDAVRAGLPVVLAVELRQKPDPWRKYSAFKLRGHMEENARVKETLALQDELEGVQVRAVMTIDLQALLSEFIVAFDHADSLQG